ncbi:hypothetical protein LNKW23_40010 [Paralimibaculum aggregatum]|uniref:Secreted protein n=1 Tax=Paralimibaculum aggregatum TaxID=3036245 RepID=A0ABQ6LQE1_9RHOB|nr:VPLPA-CTERM sorting domain-containing protein [Limibaculum sp. NKW23]GMG84785.1 hypothetical protein LNKW23_40010 [Limibaculum sp. NKW23]
MSVGRSIIAAGAALCVLASAAPAITVDLTTDPASFTLDPGLNTISDRVSYTCTGVGFPVPCFPGETSDFTFTIPGGFSISAILFTALTPAGDFLVTDPAINFQGDLGPFNLGPGSLNVTWVSALGTGPGVYNVTGAATQPVQGTEGTQTQDWSLAVTLASDAAVPLPAAGWLLLGGLAGLGLRGRRRG